jgi:hypothetical protein
VQIDVSFERWKALTALLRDENDSYDAVIKRLIEDSANDGRPAGADDSKRRQPLASGDSGAYFKDVFLPNGTELRATYKGKTYFAEISDSKWIDCESREPRTSPSQAAYSITNRNVNGWLFWVVKKPGDDGWRTLNALRMSKI